MKKDLLLTLKLSFIIAFSFIVGACSTSNFQTRKYTKGIYHPKRGSNEIDNPKKVKEETYYAVKTAKKPKSNYVSVKDSTNSEEKIATEKLAESEESKIVTNLINKEKTPVVNLNITSIKHFLSKLIQPIIKTQLDDKEMVDDANKTTKNYSLIAFVLIIIALFLVLLAFVLGIYIGFGAFALLILTIPFVIMAFAFGRKGYKRDLYANRSTFMAQFSKITALVFLCLFALIITALIAFLIYSIVSF